MNIKHRHGFQEKEEEKLVYVVQVLKENYVQRRTFSAFISISTTTTSTTTTINSMLSLNLQVFAGFLRVNKTLKNPRDRESLTC